MVAIRENSFYKNLVENALTTASRMELEVVIWTLNSVQMDHGASKNYDINDFSGLLNIIGPWTLWPESFLTICIRTLNRVDDEDEDDVTEDDVNNFNWHTMDWGRHIIADEFCRTWRKQSYLITRAFEESLVLIKNCIDKKPDPIHDNVRMLSQLLSLSSAESGLLLMAATKSNDRSFKCWLSEINFIGHQNAARLLALMLDQKENEMSLALKPNSNLVKYGLLIREEYIRNMDDLLTLSEKIATIITDEHPSREDLIARFIRRAERSELAAHDYPHLQKELHYIASILQNAVQAKKIGVNILLYGLSGTGKSQFVRVIADQIDIPLYEVLNKADDGTAATPESRYLAFVLAQNFLASNNKGLILFDEVDDMLSGDGQGSLARLFGIRTHDRKSNKAWINHILESNSVPTFWICNEAEYIDPAILRRFLYPVAFRIPPREVRKSIINKYLGTLTVSNTCLQRLTTYEELSPAQIRNAALVVSLADSVDEGESEAILLHNIQSSMQVIGQSTSGDMLSPVIDYGLEWLNIDARYSLESLITALQRRPSVSLCFYGPPGTGKTHLARFIAEHLQTPLLTKRASDLIDKYVGATEKQIAKIFAQARAENAVLLLDEADSFLRNREQARYSWEITQVNELMQHMEQFEGIFICATNNFGQLDSAALRRFSFKLAFRCLSSEQRIGLFMQETKTTLDELAEWNICDRLKQLDGLTLGDFAAVKRHLVIISQETSPCAFIELLEDELNIKRTQAGLGRSIGFV